ncbi:MAG: oxygen-independent coproporphyrinogen III oxidase [Bacteroidota bacterium]|nr:oxygen-independent coproporphyrinogen III oxidase [Bacteroidota bacterium]MDP4229632.1 oxygen-independent coproporphyrinogen III oxidase [Bacteroidota bacterium]MDP4234912.1 oxygen-independent coproporphyrinogen III oxidase [Bacteroidota bacterium]
MPNNIVELLPLLQKYSKPGPRYTSYPTAPAFKKNYSSDARLLSLERAGEDISLYFHLPFCDTLCYFCGCTMLISNNRDRIAEYLDYLEQEIKMTSTVIGDRNVVQVHWGGGTPTHLLPSEIRRLGEAIHKYFRIAKNAEISVEIDPREVTRDHIQALADVGFRRASIGVQDIDEKVQKAINRLQPESVTRQVIDWCRRCGFDSINIDLIYGLPMQTRESFKKTLERVLLFEPDRLALYNFAYVPWLKPHQKLIHIEDLPESQEKLLLFTDATNTFLEHGYEYIGMDHFAKPGDELSKARAAGTLQRNFQGYSTLAGCDLVGLGMSAISHIGTTFTQNAKSLPTYYEKIDKGQFPVVSGLEMTADDRIREEVIMRLMCDLKIDKVAINQLFDIDFDVYFSSSLDALGELESDGMVIDTPATLLITEKGRYFLRNIAMCFDAYLKAAVTTIPVFSKTL